MQKILEAIKFYQKQEKDLQKASQKNFEKWGSSTKRQRQNMACNISICQEAKEKAFWYVVQTIKESELGPILARITDNELEQIKAFNGRYLPPAQALEMALKNKEQGK